MRKLTVILIILFILSATGLFASGTKEGGKTTTATKSNLPETLELTKAYYFGEPNENPEPKQWWIDEMSKHYGIKFKVNYLPRPEYMTKFQLMMTAGDISGMGWIFGGSYYMDYARDGAILQLDDLLKDNVVWNSLPEVMRHSFDINGKMWGISDAQTPNGFARAIRKDWLDKFGLSVPKTMDEFKVAMQKFTENDPDGNGKADTIGMTTSGVWNIQDIFMAYDASTNHIGGNCVTTDPNLNFTFVDNLLKPGAVDALNFLREAYTKGWLDKETFTNTGTQMRERLLSGKYGSTYYWIDWVNSWDVNVKKNDPNGAFTYITALTSNRLNKKINPMSEGGAPWVVLANTKQAKEVVNTFVNIFFGDEYGWLSGRWGVYDKTFTLNPDKTLTLKIDPVTKSGWSTPGIGGQIPSKGWTDDIYFAAYENSTPEQIAMAKKWAASRTNYFSEGMKSNLLYYFAADLKEPNSEIWRNIGQDMTKLFEETVAAAITGTKTVEQALIDYRAKGKALGATRALEEANKAIGRTSHPQYSVY